MNMLCPDVTRACPAPFDDKVHEECGIFGISVFSGELSPAMETYTALYALQHRGQESCGIAVCDNGAISLHKDVGLVPEVFDERTLRKMNGTSAIGHVRYSTTGTNTIHNAQPLLVNHVGGDIAIAHNGNLINASEIRDIVERSGAIFHSSNDSEVIAYLIIREHITSDSLEEAVRKAVLKMKGAYSLVILSSDRVIAVRDPNGFRPLCIGKTKDSYLFASESCALDALGAEFVRDVKPGEIVTAMDGTLTSTDIGVSAEPGMCVFEYIYFARADSVIDGRSVEFARQQMGRYLAQEHPVEADLVIGVPDSGLSAAMGYSQQSGIPYGVGFIKNRYIGRTFIEPNQAQREKHVRIKLNPLAAAIKDKRVVVVDDSIVRGTTTANTISLLREAGAKEVHMRISAPPFMFPCFFGTDITDTEMLIATKHTAFEIARIIDADSLGYLSIESLKKLAAGSGNKKNLCMGCFSGYYPIETPLKANKYVFEGKRVSE